MNVNGYIMDNINYYKLIISNICKNKIYINRQKNVKY